MPVMESQLPKIIVIGAGPVGLSLGLGLAQNGFRVQVVEAGSDPASAQDRDPPGRPR